MQDLREMSGRLEGCACSYDTLSMNLASKISHNHKSNHTVIDIGADSRS